VEGVGLIVGIDRFMSEARALTNFTGNAVATVLIGTWTREIDRARVDEVLEKRLPFDEATMNADPHGLRDDDDHDDSVEDGVAVVTAQASTGDTAARTIR
jgi:aerobic C4-dicarboxylate transport protein